MEKRMRTLWIVLLACATLAGAAPVQAQTAPELAPLRSVRDRYVTTFNGMPLRVCQTEWAAWSRAHGACRDLLTLDLPDRQLRAGRLVEFVVYDGMRYERLDDDTLWTASPDEDFDPDRSLNDALFRAVYVATLTEVGAAEVDGIAATQYQYWSHDETLNELSGGQGVFDIFLAADNRVVKSQFSARGKIAGLGHGELADIWVYSDHNMPLDIAPPPAELVRSAP
jgi:hypothetical protein